MSTRIERRGGQLLVEQLLAAGFDTAFGVPGESYLEVLDALLGTPLRFVTCRQEGGAAMMAEAWGKLTGRPGLCFVTRGPGATNASAGVHVAKQDSTPMILFVGDVARGHRGREAFQEVDFVAMFSPLAKWVARIDDARRIPELVGRAVLTACSGRPGPVVIVLPEDMLRDKVTEAVLPPPAQPRLAPDDGAMSALAAELAAARRPMVIVGGGGWSEAACADLSRFASAHELPVGAAFRRQDLIDNHHPGYAGHVGIGIDPALARSIRDSDLLLVIGARLGEMTTGSYTLISAPRPAQRLVHVHADANELGRVYRPDLAIASSMGGIAGALAALAAPDRCAWSQRTAQLHDSFLDYSQVKSQGGTLDLAEIVGWLDINLAEDAILCNGAGNYAIWLHRFFRWRRYGTQLAPTSGSMGYGLPAAIAAALRHPGREVVCFAGDGCLLMHGQELATAAAQRLPLVVIVVNNGQYGTIRMHQQRRFPDRQSATALHNPDFVAYAQAFGAHAERVDSTVSFAAAFERARAAGCPALIELRIDSDIATPSLRMSELHR